jgi:hypothetical protein
MDNNPFERIIGENGRRESKRSHAAFLDYCQLGPARSLRHLLGKYEQELLPAATKKLSTIANWSKNFGWVIRAERFDQMQKEKAQAEYEARWRAQIMSGDEVLGRLSEQARSNIADFVERRTYAELDKDGNPTGQMIDSFGLNWDAVRENGHLIKSITQTANGPRIELHDGQSAIVQVGKYHKLFVERQDVSGVIEHKNDQQDAGRWDRALSLLADTIRDRVSGAGAGADGAVVAPE